MKYIQEFVDIVHHELVNNDWDEVLVITGYNGKGKTTLALHMVEMWLNKRYGECNEEDTKKYVGMDVKMFSKILSKISPKDIAVHDEAGDISSRGSMGRINRLYMQAYQVIRGDNLFTIMLLPSLWDLDPYFRKHRVRHLIDVYERGKSCFWSHKRLQRMIMLNEGLPYKNYYIVTPTFRDTFSKYNGALKKEYDAMKAKKMRSVRINLAKDVESEGDDKLAMLKARDEKIYQMREEGVEVKQIAKEFGITSSRVWDITKRMKRASAMIEEYEESNKEE